MDHEKIVQDGYDKIGKRYQDLGKNRAISELDELTKLLPSHAKILDAGCGTGIPDTKYLHDSGYNVVGVDFSDEMLRVAKENLPHVTFIKQNITELDFPDNSFDGLISFSVIIHIPREKHKPLFQQFHRLLKPDGILLVSMAWSEWEEIGEFCGEKMFWSHYKPETSLQTIKDSGFSIIKDWLVTTPDYYNEDSKSEKHYYILARNS
ncbi:MAG: class I SAM-dependent methyltransferase [Euryarchaeota archaeon]|nr:class I SAM-dependent methyltransferase [Euryarchaeota archaeon]